MKHIKKFLEGLFVGSLLVWIVILLGLFCFGVVKIIIMNGHLPYVLGSAPVIIAIAFKHAWDERNMP